MEFDQFGFGSDSAYTKQEIIAKLNSLKEKLKAFQPLFNQAFYNEINQTITSSMQYLSSERPAAAAPPGAEKEALEGKNLNQLIEQMDQHQSQTEILTSLIKYLSNLCQRVALFIISGDNCIGWLASGFEEKAVQGKKKITIPLNKRHVINQVYRSYSPYHGIPEAQPENLSLFQMIGAITPAEIMAIPLIIKGKVAGIVYLDQGFSNKPISNTAEMEIVCRIAGMAIDLIPVKKQYPSPPKEAKLEPQKAPAAAQPTTPPQWKPSAIKPAQPPAAATQPPPTPQPPAPPKTEAPPAAVGLSEALQKQQNDAKRLARLLVSEIKLYNEAKLAMAREARNVYQILREDIERSRQMYNQRVPQSIRAISSYFDEELVKILANGDPSLLGNR